MEGGREEEERGERDGEREEGGGTEECREKEG